MSEHSVSVVMQSVSRYWYLYSAAMLGLRQSSKPSDGYLAKMTRSCVSSTASTFELAFKLCCLLVFGVYNPGFGSRMAGFFQSMYRVDKADSSQRTPSTIHALNL